MVKKFDLSVLFVEDEEMIVECMSAYLRRRFRERHLALDGDEGLKKFEEFRPDIVITDIEMPHLGGFGMCEKIREIDPSTPIVIATAFSEQELVKKGEELKVRAYLLKPIDFEEIDKILFEVANELLLKKAKPL